MRFFFLVLPLMVAKKEQVAEFAFQDDKLQVLISAALKMG